MAESVERADIKTWDQLNFKDNLLRGIYAYGFENPSHIQSEAIPHIISGRDVIAQAQSGCGKTATFSIGMLENIDTSSSTTQGIVIAPTHELVRQITSVITSLGLFMDGLTVKTLVGKTSIQQDAADIKAKPPHIIVGCAGRIYDMIKRRYLETNSVKLFVLDEADEMLSQGFKEQVYNIFQYFNPNIQVVLCSATLPDEILTLSQKFMRDPVKITMKKEELNLACIQQYFIALYNDRAKFDTLKNLFSVISVDQCIIYCNSVKRVNDLYDAMVNDGFSVCAIHSNMEKSERDKMFASFRTGGFRVMISSNLTARGIDIQQVSTVINFDIPNCVHNYLHRVGRSGRWGRKGRAINFITPFDIPQMKHIEKYYGITINEFAEK
jgi:superfamily II DNA/RNA helicase